MLSRLQVLLIGLVGAFLLFRSQILRILGIQILPSQTRALRNSRYFGLAPFLDAMARHESGNFTNTLSRVNNVFSMKLPLIRPRTNSGSIVIGSGTYSAYSSINQATKDLIKWFEWVRFPINIDNTTQFAIELKRRNYFEDTIANYSNGIERNLKV